MFFMAEPLRPVVGPCQLDFLGPYLFLSFVSSLGSPAFPSQLSGRSTPHVFPKRPFFSPLLSPTQNWSETALLVFFFSTSAEMQPCGPSIGFPFTCRCRERLLSSFSLFISTGFFCRVAQVFFPALCFPLIFFPARNVRIRGRS